MLASRAMKYRVSIEGREREVDVVVAPDGRVNVSLDGEPRNDVDVLRVPGGVSIRIGAHVFDVAVGGTPDATQLAAGEARAIASVTSARSVGRTRGKPSLGGGAKEIRAPMPGRVVKVLVEVGQSIEAHERCVVIEAMKMENELRAPAAGKVAEIFVSEGVSVEGQALLLRFE